MNHWNQVDSMSDGSALDINILSGERCSLSVTLEDHLPILASWWNDPGVAIYQQVQVKQRPMDGLISMFRDWSHNNTSSGFGYSILNQQKQLVGHIVVYGIQPPVSIGTLGIMLGPEFQDQGYGLDALKIALSLAFQEYHANKVELKVFSFNRRAMHVYAKLGFVIEGTRRQAAFHGGKFFDEVLMGLLADEYQA